MSTTENTNSDVDSVETLTKNTKNLTINIPNQKQIQPAPALTYLEMFPNTVNFVFKIDSVAINYLASAFSAPFSSPHVERDCKQLLTTLALDLYVRYVNEKNIETSVVYGGIVDWLYFVEKHHAIHTTMSTGDVDILTNSLNDFNLGFRFYIEKMLGFEGCVHIIWRVMSTGLSISIFGVKVLDITLCSDEMLASAEVICAWNGMPIYIPNYSILIAQRLQYFQSINDNFSQQRFHTSETFIEKGIRGFNNFIRPDYQFDANAFKPIREKKRCFKLSSKDLAKNLSQRFGCFEEQEELILIGEEAVYLLAQLAMEKYNLITQEELDIFNKSVRVEIVDDKIRLGHTKTHQLWVCADKYSEHLDIEKPKFDFTGPVTFKTIETKSCNINIAILASLHCGYKSVKISEHIYIPNIFTLYTIICARTFTYNSDVSSCCLTMLSLLLSRLRASNIETDLTGNDKFIYGFYTERAHCIKNDQQSIPDDASDSSSVKNSN